MLKQLLQFNKSRNEKRFGSARGPLGATVIPEKAHNIPRELISRNAIRVIDQLLDAGYEAYLVGGGVRDLLLGGKPKDFDVATSATPEQLRGIFRNARIIGKRFQIVHVRFGREIIEVTTFRDNHAVADDHQQAKQSEHGVLLRDNVYGNLKTDAERRDFTVNALYYNPRSRELLEFSTGLEDLNDRVIRIVGDPQTRYREDPVRLLRAVRFAAKLGFTIEPVTEAPIREHADYLTHIPPARLFEEVLKLFMSGSATATINLLREYHLFKYLFPDTDFCMENGREPDRAMVMNAAANTDKRIRQGKKVTPAFIYAAFLWPALRASMRHLAKEQNLPTQEAMQRAAQGIISQQLAYTSIPKRFLIPMREIWSLQLRLPRRQGQRAFTLLEHPRFRAAYDFLLLREESGENCQGLGDWWTRFQADSQARDQMVDELSQPQAANPAAVRRPKRRRPRRSGSNPPSSTD
ncbi:polynucleotide adenylyltransferase PcnB [Teredinibacter turnerae]|uniref:polynucleotide adenylyltransferase PcnB n=1 Tax=Teredinibacter turnerae TaxID=2426 RepID=UPI00035E994E|nr:polynucleotide adenylyltransferase PcnB [Teredinibacter turnerae]